MAVPIANIMEPADWQDREMERLEAENAKLVMRLNAEHIVRQNVERENDRLRELVRELYEDQCADGDQWKYRDRMRELGVDA